ncbi:hypothetical protein P692DRAFT_201888435 [Suillus brevipes Sb2]|nr:hypothetical protein P692DRAFT_201888435 [Suillus brevipes Sb2]
MINVNAVFANQSQEMLWTEALFDAQKAIQLNPSSHVGYKLKPAALHAHNAMFAKLTVLTTWKCKIVASSMLLVPLNQKAFAIIWRAIDQQLNTAPLRLLNTATGLRRAQQALAMKGADLLMEHITEAAETYFCRVILSHRWDGKEPLQQDIQARGQDCFWCCCDSGNRFGHDMGTCQVWSVYTISLCAVNLLLQKGSHTLLSDNNLAALETPIHEKFL